MRLIQPLVKAKVIILVALESAIYPPPGLQILETHYRWIKLPLPKYPTTFVPPVVPTLIEFIYITNYSP